MRSRNVNQGLTVQAIAGTHVVLLGFDLDDPTGCLGFAIHRTDHTEDEAYWLRGLKVFASLMPRPMSGMDFSLRQHPLQGFQWGDYTAKPDHDYTYRLVALGGTPAALTETVEASVDVSTEAEDDGAHGVWFNRGVAGSQAFVKRFGHYTPPVGADETHPTFAWLSRGLGEAFLGFVAQATDSHWGLRGAFYEFTWHTGLRALAAAAQRGADVRLIVHGRERDTSGGGGDTTADNNQKAVTAAKITDHVVWRTAGNKSSLQHNKFLVLTHDDEPIAVWTGSTNITQGAIFGHLNVGHLIHNPFVATQFLAYWTRLSDQTATTGVLRAWTEQNNPVDFTSASAPEGVTTVFSPRATTSTLLDWYGTLFDGAGSSAHITGAFGIHRIFRDKLAVDRDRIRTVLLDKKPKPAEAIPTTDEDVRRSWGDYLHRVTLDRWAGEHLTNFNKWVKFVHTKIILIDPLTQTPTIITGSANYSDNSTTDNEENTVLIRGDGTDTAERIADIYLTEYQRIFTHFVFRNWANRNTPTVNAGGGVGRLTEDDSWTHPYYQAGSWRERQRQTFAGT